MHNPNHYAYRTIWSQEDGEYVALVAEFKSLSFLDDTPEKALSGLIELVKEVMEDMQGEGEEIPAPFAGREFKGKFQTRITPDLHRKLSQTAAEQGISLNRLVADKLAS